MATVDDTLPRWTPRQVVTGTLVVIAVGFGFWLMYRFGIVIISLILAIIIGMAIQPAVDWLRRRGLSRAASVTLVYLAFLAAIVGVLLVVVPLVVEQGSRVGSETSRYYGAFREALQQSPSSFLRRTGGLLPPLWAMVSPDRETDPELVSGVLRFASSLLSGVAIAGAILLLAYFWALDQERATRSALLLVAPERRGQSRDFYETVQAKVGEYVRGMAVLCLIVGLLSFGSYMAIGLPDALVLGLVAGLLEAVPLIGPGLGAVPAALVALSVDSSKVLWVVLATLAIQAFENTFLVPRVMRRAVGVNPFVSLLSLAALGSLFGIWGALLAIPTAAVLQLVVARFFLAPQAAAGQVPDGRDPLSVLQVDTRDLVEDVRKQTRSNLSRQEEPSDEIEHALEEIAENLDAVISQVTSPERTP
ncbi:MAG TPA: AI-2E family transporter [Anaerolineales bacterium]|nr:AI-2E family transporter [Anaerolineales bacterium]